MPGDREYIPRLPVLLVVDDYVDALDVWKIYLGGAGFDVRPARTGEEALDVARASAPDLVVLDLELPGMSGRDVARSLRSAPTRGDVPIIAVTGHSQTTPDDDAGARLFDVVLIKPCDPDLLVSEIRRLLAAREPGVGARPTA